MDSLIRRHRMTTTPSHTDVLLGCYWCLLLWFAIPHLSIVGNDDTRIPCYILHHKHTRGWKNHLAIFLQPASAHMLVDPFASSLSIMALFWYQMAIRLFSLVDASPYLWQISLKSNLDVFLHGIFNLPISENRVWRTSGNHCPPPCILGTIYERLLVPNKWIKWNNSHINDHATVWRCLVDIWRFLLQNVLLDVTTQ